MNHQQNTAVSAKYGLFTTGLAAASAGVVALSLMSAPPPGIAARPAMQLESQLLVQLEAAIVRPAVAAVAALPTPTSSVSSSTEPADTGQTDPITAFFQQLQNDLATARVAVLAVGFEVVVGGFVLFNLAIGFILKFIFDPGSFFTSPAGALRAKTTAAVQPTAMPNAAKVKIRAAIPVQATASFKPQSKPTTRNGPLAHQAPRATSTNHNHSTAKGH
jgi:hypothetical protein